MVVRTRGVDRGGDLLVRGGRLFTGSASAPGDVLVLAGRIAAVGADAAQRAPARTPELDAAGGLVTTGFGDAHVHPLHAGQGMLTCDLNDLGSSADYLAAVSAYAAGHPDAAWITGAGWSMEAFPGGIPTAAALDAVVADRPVFLPNRDGHGAWVNSRALELAGVDERTPDPADGRIERDERGRPVGVLQEGAASLVSRLVPPLTDDDLDRALDLAQERLLAWGVTHWQDAIVGPTPSGPDALPVYLRAAAAGRLRASVVGALWWDRARGLEQLDELLARREASLAGLSGPAGRFRATSVKIMQDGVAENFTAGMLEPYLDACGCATSNAGTSFVPPDLLREVVAALHAADVQVHVHALGDRAVREALDAIEVAQSRPGAEGADLRHHLAHLQVVHPDDVPRFAALGVTANIQPLWARHEPQMDELTIPFLGARRSAWQYPFASLARAGAVIASGSDWPVSTAEVLACLHTAVTRTPPGGGEPFLPQERLTLAQALLAATAGVAHVDHDEHRTGSLTPGLDGDLVVLDGDPFAADGGGGRDADHPDVLARTRVAATVVAGDVVHDASAPCSSRSSARPSPAR